MQGENTTTDKEVSQTLEPIAIVGMAMRLPGNVQNADEFWQLLVEKRSGLCDVPEDRFNVQGFHDPSGKPGTFKMEKGFYLQNVNIQQFDTSFFSLSKPEVERLDPQQRQLLEVTYECMEDAGATCWRGSSIGCYVGVFGEDWMDLNAKETQHRGGYRITGYGDFTLANRLSYEFDLHGPSMTVKTACSSSLVCLDMACQAIRNGDCQGAIVCGTSLIFSPTMTIALQDQGVLSPTGTCKSFDAAADGYARGEAVNAVYIKKLSDALADGDCIRAVIRGTGVNTDGRTNGMTIPSPLAQEDLIRRTYHQAGIKDLSATAFVECHSTGTAVGDPLEVSAVAKCFEDYGMIITSVKPNVGHSEGAAGLTSLIKAVLSINRRQIPPNINFQTPNPDIPFQSCRLHVPVDVENWPQNRAERVSVNSFGIGGVNAHVIVESLEEYRKCNPIFGFDKALKDKNADTKDQNDGLGYSHAKSNGYTTEAEWTQHCLLTPSTDSSYALDIPAKSLPQLLLLSSNSEASLNQTIEAYRDYASTTKESLGDVAYTLANRRDHKNYRAYAVVGSQTSFDVCLPESVKPPLTIGWVFTGQGAQWPEMGSELLDHNPVFRKTIEDLDNFLQQLPEPPSWTIEEELRKSRGESRVQKAAFGHPLCVAVQIGLINILRSWGVKPDFVIGHSSGEMAAAYACGAITAESAIAAATFRGITSGRAEPEKQGSMAAIGLGRDDIAIYMTPAIVIACENSHCNVTISGDRDQVESVVQHLNEQRPEIFARSLRVEKAFHSPHMLEYGPEYELHLQAHIHSVDPSIPFYSSVTGKKLTGDETLGPAYWRGNMESPVLFNSALRAALADQENRAILLEIGPHPALKGPIGQILKDLGRSTDIHMGTLIRGRGQEESLYHVAGKLFQQHICLNYSEIFPRGKHISSLPKYSWKRETAHWAEPRVSREWRFRQHPPHDLLGSRVNEVSNEPIWRNKLSLQDLPWLTGHEVGGQIVFPAAGYISMVGEAIRQLHGEWTYSLNNVRITVGLVLEHDKVTELVTRLLPSATVNLEETPSYAFAVSSFNGSKWIQHCTGEARASVDKSICLSAPEPVPLPRQVDEDDWYDILSNVGLKYSGVFRGLRNITASPQSRRSIATVSTDTPNAGEKYAIHPGVIDQCFQLFTVSAFRGLRRNCQTIAVPTFIEEIVISPTSESLIVAADVTSIERGSFVGNLSAQKGSKIILSLKGFKSTALTSADATEERIPLVTQFEWRPHASFAQLDKYMHPCNSQPREWAVLEELILLCMYSHRESITLTDSTPSHLFLFFKWMQSYIDRYQSGANAFVPVDLQLWGLTGHQRAARIEQIVAEVATTKWEVFSTAIYRLFLSASALFAGTIHALNVLMKDDVLTRFYLVGDSLQYMNAIRLIAHTNPRLRVLEIGAGTGGTTGKMLEALTSSYGERMYSSYTYTDVSAGFLQAAKERFNEYENIEYKVLDISQDTVQQGFLQGNYDLIIGSNVVHATPSLQTSLGHLKTLLSPRGRLFLVELCPEAKFVNYVMGFFSGWWLGVDDNRVHEPYISPERWVDELRTAGFNAPDAIALDGPALYQISAGIIASPAAKRFKPSAVSILCYSPLDSHVNEVKASLEREGIAVDICVFGQPLPANDVISLLELQESVVHDFTEQSFNEVVRILKTVTSRLVWATRSSQIGCKDPRNAMTLGLARTARNELSVQLATVELDESTSSSTAADSMTKILLRLCNQDLDSHGMDPDWEFAVVEGKILIPRLHWKTFATAFSERREEKSAVAKQIMIETPGLLNTLKWCEVRHEPLARGQVLVKTKSVGLNFKDILIALGVLESSTREIGLEGCGVVAATGPEVSKFAVGDRVMYMSSGCFSTTIILSEVSCVKIDDSMTFDQGAALPCVYATAIMALLDKGNLQRGQSVLIHSACGGVGLAAIQIAQMIGAEVFCTVGSEEKVRYLREHRDIPQSHIFNSRDSSFLCEIMKATNNKGVDVVLNSLSGALLHASWKCVAEFGVMIEIGKRDFRRHSKLSMELFEKNRTFVGLDLGQVARERPEKAAALLERCIRWIQEGALKPDSIAKVWGADEIQEAFKFMQSGRHIGKIIINMPEGSSQLHSMPTIPSPVLRNNRSYLLVGGLGGLGRAVATWLVEQGARHIIFMSRSAEFTPELQSYIKELSAQGCQVQLVKGSVSNMADVQRVVHNAAKPIAGVINLSMVLKDVSLREMSFKEWSMPLAPKVQGTWNLHNAMPADLDFFILCSSYSGIVGQWGQANYAAANTFLDAFAQYRHQRGLVASVIDIGVMGEIGYVSKNRDIFDLFQEAGLRISSERDFLNAINLAIERSRPMEGCTDDGAHISPNQFLLGLVTTQPITSPANRLAWKTDMRMSIYHNINGSSEAENALGSATAKDKVEVLLTAASSNPRVLEDEGTVATIAASLASALCHILIKDDESIKMNDSLEAIGVDSLVGIELRNWIRHKFGIEISVMAIVQNASLLTLAETMAQALIKRFQSR